jgi:hypothetical protein
MNNIRKISPHEIQMLYFPVSDVLNNAEDKSQRVNKLLKAVILSNCEHCDVGIVIQLLSGEVIETFSDLVDYADDFVIIKGGFVIPVKAILDIEL